MEEMIPPKYKEYNKMFNTHECTYYFAHATGERKREKEKSRETLKEPRKLAQRVMGFASDVKERVKYRNNTGELKRRTKETLSLYEMIGIIFKLGMNPLSLEQKVSFDILFGTDWSIDYLSNIHNPEMNNVTAIDHATRDFIDDTDYLLNRMTAEFPRLSSGYKTKSM